MLRAHLRRPPHVLPPRRPARLPRGHRQLPIPQVLRGDVGRRRAGCRAATCQASRRGGAAHVMRGARSCDRAARLRGWQGKQPAISCPLSWRVAWPGTCGTSPLVSWSVRRPERGGSARQGRTGQAGARRSRRGGGGPRASPGHTERRSARASAIVCGAPMSYVGARAPSRRAWPWVVGIYRGLYGLNCFSFN